MAYRRKQQGLSVTIKGSEDEDDVDRSSLNSSSSFLAAKAIRASSAHRDSSLSYAYSSPLCNSNPTTSSSSPFPIKDSKSYQYISMKNLNESKHGFWGNLARKAKAILDDYDDTSQQSETPQNTTHHMPSKKHDTYNSNESHRKPDSPALRKGLDAITSSINYIGNAVEEGLVIVESRTAGVIQETRKHIRKKPSTAAAQDQGINRPRVQTQGQRQPLPQPPVQTDQELQLKASRDVAMAMAAKAKLLLRELKTVKADLAFAKERCAQLEEENKILWESGEKGDNPEDDDLIRLQLESLLAEKSRLAHENSVYARENCFLREVVEYHQLTMQDVMYLDEDTEEVTEVYPIKVVSNQHSDPAAPPFSPEVSLQVIRDGLRCPSPPPQVAEISKNASPHGSVSPL